MINEQRIVIGYEGLIGSAIYKLFKAHIGIDINNNIGEDVEQKRYRIMHVCIKHSNKFNDIIKEYVNKFQPHLIIIHSTVPVGTTRKIFNSMSIPVVHVPFHGHHTDSDYSPVSMLSDPFLYIMSVGCIDNETGNVACDYVNRFGFHSELQNAETTEFAKIMSTNLVLAVIKEWQRHIKLLGNYDGVSWNGVVNIIKDIAEHEPYGYLNRAFQRLCEIDSKISGKHCLTDNKDLL